MTQALINSLNILSDKNINLASKMPKSEGMDFGKIFENKTFDYSKTLNDIHNYANKNNEPKMQVQDKNTCDVTQKTNTTPYDNQKNGEYVKDDNKKPENNEEDKNTLQGTVTKQAEEETKEIEELIPFTVCTEIIDDEDEEELIQTITTDESELIDETAAEEEDPTMYKELITLENPTALIMLQSQITQTVNLKASCEQAKTAADNLLNTQSNSQNVTDEGEAAAFKQFDTILAKDAGVINSTAKHVVNAKTTAQKLSSVVNENMLKELNVEVISSQAAEAESSMGDLMQNQSPQEQTTRIMIQGDVKYESVAAEAAKAASQAKTVNVTPSKIIDQITKQMENLFNNSKLNLVLNPGSLGKLHLQMINTKEGLIAQFTVTTQEARDILMKGLDSLKESLLAQGVNIDNVSVKLEDTEGEYKQDYTEQEGSKGGNKHQGAKKQKEQGKDFEEMMFNLENDGNV